MKEILVNNLVLIITAVIGTLGFCFLFNLRKSKLIYGCIGGLTASVVYCICADFRLNTILQNMLAAAAATLYAELVARLVKAPATVFLIPAVIPLTPGGSLYYTMKYMVDGNDLLAKQMGEKTLVVALAIAVGIVFVSVIFYQLSHRNVQLKVSFDNNRDRKW